MADFPLTAYRKARGLSQVALGRELDVSSVTISRWEARTRKIGKKHLSEVSKKTGIPARDLRPDLAEILERA